jgi:hypothetical protein
MVFINKYHFYSFSRFCSILSIIVLFILLLSLLIISIKLSIVKTNTSVFSIASTVAVLSSSFNKAISHTISQVVNSAILLLLIITFTFQDLIIYASQLDSAH